MTIEQDVPAVLSRSRRPTAGKRMSSLVGKALEEDEMFWGHSTWQDDDERRRKRRQEEGEECSSVSSDDASFDLNDEPEENQVDVFDSDFDDSESEVESGEDEEEGGRLQEDKKRKRPAAAERKSSLAVRRRGKAKRSVGSGLNAGLVLNLPVVYDESKTQVKTKEVETTNSGTASGVTTSIVEQIDSEKVLKLSLQKQDDTNITALRSRRQRTRRAPPASNEATHQPTDQRPKKATRKKQTQKRKFTQDELLAEAANVTEPENERWILSRKRFEASYDLDEKKKAGGGQKEFQKIAMKFHSRRGCYNTITFSDMDSLPSIFRRAAPDNIQQREEATKCIITGKIARYRDPLTKKSYHDALAFRELRRRHAEGSPLFQGYNGSKESDSIISQVCVVSNSKQIFEKASLDVKVEPIPKTNDKMLFPLHRAQNVTTASSCLKTPLEKTSEFLSKPSLAIASQDIENTSNTPSLHSNGSAVMECSQPDSVPSTPTIHKNVLPEVIKSEEETGPHRSTTSVNNTVSCSTLKKNGLHNSQQTGIPFCYSSKGDVGVNNNIVSIYSLPKKHDNAAPPVSNKEPGAEAKSSVIPSKSTGNGTAPHLRAVEAQ